LSARRQGTPPQASLTTLNASVADTFRGAVDSMWTGYALVSNLDGAELARLAKLGG
jgi:hypothetical protein